MANKNDHFVVAYYVNTAAAEAAAEDLKNWDDANKDIKLGAIGVLHLDAAGHLKVMEIGQRETRKGALWGTAIGGALGVLTAGILLVPGMAVGAAAGGVLGAANHKSLGMSDEERDSLAEQLRHGGAALGVMCDEFEIEATVAELTRLGGKTQVYTLPTATAAELRAAAEAQNEAATAVDDAVSRTTDVDQSGAAAVAATSSAAGLAAALGLDSNDSDALSNAGIDKASTLLKTASTASGRAALAKETGVDESVIYASVKKIDLMRVKGVGHKYAALLLATGIDSVPELGTRNPANLVAAMTTTNATAAIVEHIPTEAEVSGWVAQAKTMQRVVN